MHLDDLTRDADEREKEKKKKKESSDTWNGTVPEAWRVTAVSVRWLLLLLRYSGGVPSGALQAERKGRLSCGHVRFCREQCVLSFRVFHPGLNLSVKLFYLMRSCDYSVTFREGGTSCYLLQPHENGEALSKRVSC